MPAEAPRRLGHYELLEQIGSGGMGAVYKARHTSIGRIVALKVLPPEFASDRHRLELFLGEARASGALDHPNIVRVYDAGLADGQPYICMEYIDGPSVGRLIRQRGRLAPIDALRIALQIGQALEHAHSAGIIHCDIKPANILIDNRGTAKLADLGLARRLGTELPNGRTHGMGTPHYVAPEQARNASCADERSDIYSLGATLYHMVTGRVPFDGESTAEIVLRAATQPLVGPRSLVPEIPESLAAVIERMMAKSPQDRYASAAELLDALHKVERELLGGRMPKSAYALIAAGALVAIAAGVFVGSVRRPAEGPGDSPRPEAPVVATPAAPNEGATHRVAPAPVATPPEEPTRIEPPTPPAKRAEGPAEEAIRHSEWCAKAGRYGEALQALKGASAPPEVLEALHERIEKESGATLKLARELAASGRFHRAEALLTWALASWGIPLLEARAEDALRAVEAERLLEAQREELRIRAEAAARRLADSAELLARKRRFAEASRVLEGAQAALEHVSSGLASELKRRLAALEALGKMQATIQERLARGQLRPAAKDVFTRWGPVEATLVSADEERIYIEIASGTPSRAAKRWEELSAEEYARLAELCANPRSEHEMFQVGLAWLEAGRPEESLRLWKGAPAPHQAWTAAPARGAANIDEALRRARAFDEALKLREALRELELALEALDEDVAIPDALNKRLSSIAADLDRSCGTSAVAGPGPGEAEELFYDFSVESSRTDWRISGSAFRQGERGIVSPSGGSCILEFDGAFAAGGELELAFRFFEEGPSRLEVALVPDEPDARALAVAAFPGGQSSPDAPLAKGTMRMVIYRGWRELAWSVSAPEGSRLAGSKGEVPPATRPERPVIAVIGWVELRSVRFRGCFDPTWRRRRRAERLDAAAAALERALASNAPTALERFRAEFADCRAAGFEAMKALAALGRAPRSYARWYPELAHRQTP